MINLFTSEISTIYATISFTTAVSPALWLLMISCLLVAPVCTPGQIKFYSVSREEVARIVCDLEANPNTVNFTWVFNNSVDTVDIPQNHISSDGSKSTLSYTANNELDYGTLLCWGRNEIGVQRQPCVYHLNPAGE